jgi:hypothetical protein
MDSRIKRETKITIRQKSNRAARPVKAHHATDVIRVRGHETPSALYAVLLTPHVPSVDCVP